MGQSQLGESAKKKEEKLSEMVSGNPDKSTGSLLYFIDCHHGDGISHLLGTLCCPEYGWGAGICKLVCCDH